MHIRESLNTMMMGTSNPRWTSIEGLKICPRCQYWGLDHEKTCPRCGRILIDHCFCGAPILSPAAQKCFHCGEPLEHVQDKFEKWNQTHRSVKPSEGLPVDSEKS